MIACSDWGSVASLLGEKAFFFGDQVSTVDATLFAFIDSTLCFPIETPIATYLKRQKNLVAYHVRMKARFFG